MARDCSQKVGCEHTGEEERGNCKKVKGSCFGETEDLRAVPVFILTQV